MYRRVQYPAAKTGTAFEINTMLHFCFPSLIPAHSTESLFFLVLLTCLKYLLVMLFFLQRELSFKVQIFEKKVETYKKMTRKFSNAVTYIKVRLLIFLHTSCKTSPLRSDIFHLHPVPAGKLDPYVTLIFYF